MWQEATRQSVCNRHIDRVNHFALLTKLTKRLLPAQLLNFLENWLLIVFYVSNGGSSKLSSSQFLPRDAMHKRGLCCHAVSVCPSVTLVDHVKTNTHILDIFSPSGSHTIVVFPYQRGCRYSDGNPPNGGVECKGYDKITIFSQIYRSISETVIVRWAHAAKQFVSIEFSFHPYNI